jgi:nitrogen fixation protein NifB
VVLSAGQALAYLDGLVQRRHDVAVVGIAGPGDPLANPDATLETLRLVRSHYPDLLLCLATNGLALAEHAAELERLHLSHLTVTINTLDPATGAHIYAWVCDGRRVLRGEEGAGLLVQRQMAGLEALRGTGILIKVNSILIPGINDEQIPDIAAEVKRRGAHLFNCVPLIPAARTAFASLPEPDPAMVARVRAAAAAHLPLMEHCSRCRADACGLLNEGTTEVSISALRAAANLPDPVVPSARPNIAVATREGLLINDHLGEAESFAVFAPEATGFRLVENRPAPPPGGGSERWRDLAAGLADCRAVLVAGVGPIPRRTLESSGLRVVEAEGLIEDALEPLFRDAPLPASMARRFEGCGNGCGGTGQGCG